MGTPLESSVEVHTNSVKALSRLNERGVEDVDDLPHGCNEQTNGDAVAGSGVQWSIWRFAFFLAARLADPAPLDLPTYRLTQLLEVP